MFIRLWDDPDHDPRFDSMDDEIEELLAASPVLYRSLFDACMGLLSEDDRSLVGVYAERVLGAAASDHIFEMIPAATDGLNLRQSNFIGQILHMYLNKEPTRDRFELFKDRAPGFTTHWIFASAKRLKYHERHDPYQDRARVSELLKMAGENPHAVANNVALVTAERVKGNCNAEAIKAEDLAVLAERIGPYWRERIRRALMSSLSAADLQRTVIAWRPEVRFQRPFNYYEAFFWYLKDCEGLALPPTMAAAVLRCFAFHDQESSKYIDLLEELRRHDEPVWRETIHLLLDDPLSRPHELVPYLISSRYDGYINRCRERLLNGPLYEAHVAPLTLYWQAMQPPDAEDVLWRLYEWVDPLYTAARARQTPEAPALIDPRYPDFHGRGNSVSFEILLFLVRTNDQRAWGRLADLVAHAQVPVADHHWIPRPDTDWQAAPERAGTLADWFALTLRAGGDRRGYAHDAQAFVLNGLMAVAGLEGSIIELQRLRAVMNDAHSRLLSYHILQIENQLLASTSRNWSPTELIPFLLRQQFRVVHTERDLFEVACDAIQALQAAFAQGVSVAGYWNHLRREDDPVLEPKWETDCQNVLWPQIQSALQSWGVAGAEERRVGADIADFWAVIPQRNRPNIELIIELKTARHNYSHRQIVDPIESQLWDQYLRPLGQRFGIYIVLWFKTDKYEYPTDWATPADLLSDLEQRARLVGEQHGVEIACFVLDVTAPYRGR